MPSECTPRANRQSQHVDPRSFNERRVDRRWFIDWICAKCRHTWTTDAGTGARPDYRREQ